MDIEQNVMRSQQCSVVFQPRLFVRRYQKVQEILEKNAPEIESLVDLGCADCRFLERLRNGLECLSKLRRLTGVDRNSNVLRDSVERLQPLNFDFLQQRRYPLCIDLFCADLFEWCSFTCQVDAVVCIETVEHLEENSLAYLADLIIAKMAPKIIVVTTPNKDFNPLFGMKETEFRRHDHTFEWSQTVFQLQCEQVVKRFPDYSVSFDGVGNPPSGHSLAKYGYCTQIAIFKLSNSAALTQTQSRQSGGERFDTSNMKTGMHIKLVAHIEYPYKVDCGRENRLRGKYLLNQCLYYVRFLRDSSETEESISLETLCKFAGISSVCGDPKELGDLLSSNGWSVKKDTGEVVYVKR